MNCVDDAEFDEEFVAFFKTKPKNEELLAFVEKHGVTNVFAAIDAKIQQVLRQRMDRDIDLRERLRGVPKNSNEAEDVSLDHAKWLRNATFFQKAMEEARGRIKRLMHEAGKKAPGAGSWADVLQPDLERIADALDDLVDIFESKFGPAEIEVVDEEEG